MIDHLSFLKKYATEDHYNFDDVAAKHEGPPKYADLNSLKNFTDEELTKLAPKIKIHRADLDSRHLFSLMQGESKHVLPNLIAHHIAINKFVSIEPHHHVFMKMPVLISQSVRDIAVAIPHKRAYGNRNVDSIPVEAMYHPNLTKEHALDIVNSAREANNPYLSQMERQYKKRYGE